MPSIRQDGKTHFSLVSVYKCAYCDYLAMFSSTMIQHLQEIHPEEVTIIE